MTPTNEIVYRCIVDLCSINRVATREVVVQETGLKFSVVDDHVKKLREADKIRKVVNGVYEPVEMVEDRPVSGTVVPGGRYKLEIGDNVLQLTLREVRAIAAVTGGVALQFGR
jgi:hypothetical protein